MDETNNPQHIDCGGAELRLDSFYPAFVASIDPPHQGVLDFQNHFISHFHTTKKMVNISLDNGVLLILRQAII